MTSSPCPMLRLKQDLQLWQKDRCSQPLRASAARITTDLSSCHGAIKMGHVTDITLTFSKKKCVDDFSSQKPVDHNTRSSKTSDLWDHPTMIINHQRPYVFSRSLLPNTRLQPAAAKIFRLGMGYPSDPKHFQ